MINIPCISTYSKNPTSCNCLCPLNQSKELFEKLLVLLIQYESFDRKNRQPFLNGLLAHGFAQREKNIWEKKEPNNLLPGVFDDNNSTTNICANSLQALFCIGRKQWYKVSENAMLPKQKNNYENNLNAQCPLVQEVIDFLHNIGEEEGETYATRFIRMETRIAIRNADLNQIELPSSFTKRGIYERFCYERGWIARSASNGSYPPINKYEERPFDNDVDDDNDDQSVEGSLSLFPSGSTRAERCSWNTFSLIWNKYLPYLSVRSPSKDTCVQCNVFRNGSKYASANDNEADDMEQPRSGLICPQTNSPSLFKPLDDEIEETRGSLILQAAKHVKSAQSQKKTCARENEGCSW